MYNVIADIAGRYKTLQALLKKMPEAIPLSVGDMVDRGDASKQVLDFFMQPGREALLGNHEHMMWDYCRREEAHLNNEVFVSQYSSRDWLFNGGTTTLKSFGGKVDSKYVRYIESLPIQKLVEVDNKKILISHTFTPSSDNLPNTNTLAKIEHSNKEFPFNMIWNRRYPIEIEGIYLQIAGHNSQFGFRKFANQSGDTYAICMDASAQEVLTGIHLPTMTIYTQEYLEDTEEEIK